LQTATANASIDTPTARIKSSVSDMVNFLLRFEIN
jgi:hypothetical protein